MIYLVILLFVLATFSHATGLRVGISNQSLDIKTKEHSWMIHFILNGLLWIYLIVSIILFEIYFLEATSGFSFFIGSILFFIGIAVTIYTYIKLGTNIIMGRPFFFPKETKPWITKNIYKHLSNPMYDGFILMFIGLALTRGIIENLLLAVTSFLLLNVYLSYIERGEHNWKIF